MLILEQNISRIGDVINAKDMAAEARMQ